MTLLHDDDIHKLHDEDILPDEFPQELQEYDFGYWPEIAGLIATAIIIWIMFHFAEGAF